MEDRNKKYERALKQVKEQKDWYTHLFVYVFINVCVQLFYWGVFDGGKISDYIPWWAKFMMPILWGVSLIVHYHYAFKPEFLTNNVIKRWEQKKIEEYMRQDEEEYNSRFRENVN